MNSKVEIRTKEDHGLWYDNNIDPYKGLAEIIAVTLKNSLISQKISFVDVPYRSKTKKSFLKKIEDKLTEKDYSPESMTDLAGIRVITLIESDVQKVCDLVSKMFNVHQADSVNKSEKLGEEKVGYRSVHFVCDVGEERATLPEFSLYKGLCFEIQVRTALEHAWAEIEHDRGYKLDGKLPSNLNRRFKLLAGLLESADLEFNRLTIEIEEYAQKLAKNISDKTFNFELTNVGILTLLQEKYRNVIVYDYNKKKEIATHIIPDLQKFGIEDLQDLDNSIQAMTEFKIYQLQLPITGFFRVLMMFIDIDRYFENTYVNSTDQWKGIPHRVYQSLLKKYEKEKLENLFKQYKIKY